MAQTIALQRGVASITWDGTTQTTLWTQSGGTATRVIFNGCSAYGGSNTGMNMALFVKLSGGTGSYCVAFIWSGNSTGSGCLDFRPGNTNVAGAANGSSSLVSGTTVLSFNNTDYGVNTNLSATNLQGGVNGSSGFSSQTTYEFCPAQFWIGPGDSIVFKCRNTVSGGGQVAYSFTTITES